MAKGCTLSGRNTDHYTAHVAFAPKLLTKEYDNLPHYMQRRGWIIDAI